MDRKAWRAKESDTTEQLTLSLSRQGKAYSIELEVVLLNIYIFTTLYIYIYKFLYVCKNTTSNLIECALPFLEVC